MGSLDWEHHMKKGVDEKDFTRFCFMSGSYMGPPPEEREQTCVVMKLTGKLLSDQRCDSAVVPKPCDGFPPSLKACPPCCPTASFFFEIFGHGNAKSFPLLGGVNENHLKL